MGRGIRVLGREAWVRRVRGGWGSRDSKVSSKDRFSRGKFSSSRGRFSNSISSKLEDRMGIFGRTGKGRRKGMRGCGIKVDSRDGKEG